MTTDSLTAYQAVNAKAADARAFLYDAADALQEWGDSSAAVTMRTAAELLGTREVVRRLRLEALVQTAQEVEHEATGTVMNVDPAIRLGAALDALRRSVI